MRRTTKEHKLPNGLAVLLEVENHLYMVHVLNAAGRCIDAYHSDIKAESMAMFHRFVAKYQEAN